LAAESGAGPAVSAPRNQFLGGLNVSIVRVGLAETKRFAEGYEAIFGKKKDQPAADESETEQPRAAKKPAAKAAKKKAKKK
jgi:hypothetical protein